MAKTVGARAKNAIFLSKIGDFHETHELRHLVNKKGGIGAETPYRGTNIMFVWPIGKIYILFFGGNGHFLA